MRETALGAKRLGEGEIVAPRGIARADEVDETALDPGDRRHGRFAGSDLAGVALALQRARPLERLVDRIDAERDRAHRGPMQQRERVGEALALAVDDEVDLALRIEIDVLRAVPPSALESEALEQRGQFARRRVARRKLDEFGPLDHRRRRKRRQIGERRVAARGALRRQRFAGGAQRAHAVDRDRGGRGAAKLVVEDFERQRAAIARTGHRVEIVDDRIVALAGIAAIVPAQRQRVHGERRRIGDLHERDLLGRQGGDRLDRIAADADVKAVEHNPEIVAIGGAHDVPGRGPVLHPPPPGERLVADPHAVLAGEIGQFGEVAGGALAIVDRVGRDIRA